MNAYLNYLLEANLGLGIFLMAYYLLLNRETDFKAKRTYVLMSIGISLLFPLLHFRQSDVMPSLSTIIPPTWLPEFTITANGQAPLPKEETVSVWGMLNNLYLAGVVVFLTLFIVRLAALLRKMRWATTYPSGRYRIVESNENRSSFSFFGFIFIGQADMLSEADKQQIIRHERIHANQFHSIDILLMHVLGILFWFNPLLRTYKKIFIQLHEFEADARAVEDGDENDYCNLMARVALLSADIKLANHFSNSLTLKRIEMIRTIKTRIVRWKFAAIGAMFSAFFMMVACQDQVKNEVTDNNEEAQTAGADDKIFMVVEESASLPGGIEKLKGFLAENLRYPAGARQQGKEGTVFVQFIVNKDGSLSDFTIIKGVDESLDKEALRVSALMPFWNPGRQQGKPVRQRFVLPIKFKLNASEPESASEPSPVGEKLNVVTEVTTAGAGKKLITGRVSDLSNNGLRGANIILRGSTTGTTADKDGNFRLEVPVNSGELVVSFVGYETHHISF